MIKSVQSASFFDVTPSLSVLIPFYKDDASPLIDALLKQNTNKPVEIILADDGTQDTILTQLLSREVTHANAAVKLMTLAENQGRSSARNHLQNAARSDWLLFLDADMLPTTPDFLQNYLDYIAEDTADIIFGGFTVEECSDNKAGELHRALSASSDCLSLIERQAAGAQYVASSNLCLRKSVIEDQPFDSGFTGWGWEDSEWAARVSNLYSLIHIDNPALHLGLETSDTLLRRFKSSADNYERFTQKHPEIAQNLKLYHLSKSLQKVPAQKLMRPLLKLIVKSPSPMKARLIALKLWRASWYAERLS